MEVRVYRIDQKDLQKVKAQLEAEDKFEVFARCERCGKVLEGKLTASEFMSYLPAQKAGKEVPPKKLCDCGGRFIFEKKELIKNEFVRVGYKLRAAQSLGMENGNFLYIKAHIDFFDKNEKILTELGAQRLEPELEKEIKEKIESEEESAAAGMGTIFG